MIDAYIQKLDGLVLLSDADRQRLRAIIRPTRRLGAREDIVEDDGPRHVNLLLEGWACRYRQLEDGRRQIIGILLPGDLCDPHIAVPRMSDHPISTLTPVVLARIPHEALQALAARSPGITEALWRELLVSLAIQREFAVSLGRRTASERLGHLLCELFLRLQAVGMTDGPHCEIPVTQTDLSDVLGLSSVHVNRTLQELRLSGLITLRGKYLTLHDLPALQAASLFDPGYLHLDPRGSLVAET